MKPLCHGYFHNAAQTILAANKLTVNMQKPHKETYYNGEDRQTKKQDVKE